MGNFRLDRVCLDRLASRNPGIATHRSQICLAGRVACRLQRERLSVAKCHGLIEAQRYAISFRLACVLSVAKCHGLIEA